VTALPGEEFARRVIEKANEFKNPATGDRLGDALEKIIIACAKATETEDEFLDCIDDALAKLREAVQELKRKRR